MRSTFLVLVEYTHMESLHSDNIEKSLLTNLGRHST